jgi:hypothetical protein
MCYLLFSRNQNQINSKPISTCNPLYDVIVDLFFMLKTHEESHDLYLDVIEISARGRTRENLET